MRASMHHGEDDGDTVMSVHAAIGIDFVRVVGKETIMSGGHHPAPKWSFREESNERACAQGRVGAIKDVLMPCL